MKRFFLGLLVLIIVLVVAALAILKLGSRDLGVTFDPEAFDRITEEYDIDYDEGVAEYCISCDNVVYSEPTFLEGDVNSDELSSIVQTLNNKNGIFKDIRLKIGSGDNQGEMAANLDLSQFGVDFKAPVYASGSFSVSDNRIGIHIDSGAFGLIPVPSEYISAGEEYLSGAVNDQLSRMPELRIDDLSVKDGILNYDGVFPRVIKMK